MNGVTFYWETRYDISLLDIAVLADSGLTVDSDADGMSDKYENAYHLNPYDPSDAALDPDRDGKTNLQEHDDRTDPRLHNNAPAIIAITTNILLDPDD
jgi:hypothetical protein